MNNKEQINLTDDSMKLFISLLKDSEDWNGNPPIDGILNSKLNGNLTDLKKKGLIETFVYEGSIFAQFTVLGKEFSKTLTY